MLLITTTDTKVRINTELDAELFTPEDAERYAEQLIEAAKRVRNRDQRLIEELPVGGLVYATSAAGERLVFQKGGSGASNYYENPLWILNPSDSDGREFPTYGDFSYWKRELGIKELHVPSNQRTRLSDTKEA